MIKLNTLDRRVNGIGANIERQSHFENKFPFERFYSLGIIHISGENTSAVGDYGAHLQEYNASGCTTCDMCCLCHYARSAAIRVDAVVLPVRGHHLQQIEKYSTEDRIHIVRVNTVSLSVASLSIASE